jgi:hypothetical protein
MNSKQLLAITILAASATVGSKASAQYATDGIMASTKVELIKAYQAKDLVKIYSLKAEIIELNKQIMLLELQEFGSQSAVQVQK